MPSPLDTRLDNLLRPHGWAGRVLVTGWFSFLDGEVTAGDALAQRAVSASLDRLGIVHETAWSPAFVPAGLSLEEACPSRYEQLLFVCGPVHGAPFTRLHERFASCRRVAVGVSVVDPDSRAVRGFHRILARDGPNAAALPDLAADAPASAAAPVVGVALTYGQGEYGDRRAHDRVAEVLLPWLARQDCARIDADTRLAHDDWRHCRTPDQYLSLIGRLDLVVTDRLHGLVLALRAGVPVLAVDPVLGGAKVTAQSGVLRWPAMVGSEDLSTELLDHWWSWCLSPAGGAAARRRSTRFSPVSGRPVESGGSSRLAAGDGGTRPEPGAEAGPWSSPTPPMEET
ncbi:polysaccharide pyruvyl transferase family protein [Streptomyces sp. DH18]|uniref:polysaccharide pyruvyl transferase family protein n=1 Tax=Streptomyces sp. DH18 TaxID=3040126 RepID=UPI0024411EAA|nr:polysaccharide pyruvyl transferase family protein [Streptomyces sp. DH18]MDG9687595.1 polysaccharide pyruvyl transferase family protein [Streptomyces sp. DH18]